MVSYMENPFIITGYIKPEYFCDREKEAERIINKVTGVDALEEMAEQTAYHIFLFWLQISALGFLHRRIE